MVPNLEAGYVLARQLEYLGGAEGADIAPDARVPIILTICGKLWLEGRCPGFKQSFSQYQIGLYDSDDAPLPLLSQGQIEGIGGSTWLCAFHGQGRLPIDQQFNDSFDYGRATTKVVAWGKYWEAARCDGVGDPSRRVTDDRSVYLPST